MSTGLVPFIPRRPPAPIRLRPILQHVMKRPALSLIDLLHCGEVTLRPLSPPSPRLRPSMLALDRAIRSHRETDEFGFMRVRDCVLSRAVISPYRGGEVPLYAELGLDPQKTYSLLRDLAELRKATPSFSPATAYSSPARHRRPLCPGTGDWRDRGGALRG